jgi:hypothetical protein
MKNTSIKALLVAGFTLATIGAASAYTTNPVIRIAGSSAFRQAANQGLVDIGFTCVACDASGTTASGNYKFLDGVWVRTNGTTIDIVQTSFQGSDGGIQSVAGGAEGTPNAKTVPFLPITSSGFLYTDGKDNTDLHVADFTLADNSQSISRFYGKRAGDGYNYAALTEYNDANGSTLNGVGVVTFAPAIVGGLPSDKSAVTSILSAVNGINEYTLRQVIAAGVINFSQLSANINDTASQVYWSGRSQDSGTRYDYLALSGLPVTQVVKQYKVDFAGVNGATKSTISLYPREVIDGIDTQYPGNSGYAAGPTLAGYMVNGIDSLGTLQVQTLDGSTINTVTATKTTTAATGTQNKYNYILSILSVGDAVTATTGAAAGKLLMYGGIQAAKNSGFCDQVRLGAYPLWNYEHLYTGPNTGTGAATVANALGDKICQYKSYTSAVPYAPNANPSPATTATLSPNVALQDMYVARNGDASAIFSN